MQWNQRACRGQHDGGNDGGGSDTKRQKHDPNFKLEAKSCPREEWFKLSEDQRDAVIKLRGEAKRKKKAAMKSKRGVAAATANAVPKGQVGGSKAVTFEPDQRQDQAGNQFGRHAHQQ